MPGYGRALGRQRPDICVSLPDDVYAELGRRSAATGEPMAAIARRGIIQLLAGEMMPATDPSRLLLARFLCSELAETLARMAIHTRSPTTSSSDHIRSPVTTE